MKRFLLACLALASVAALDARPAEACGGCFVPPGDRTVVTDHRMALSISTEQTVLWDQIRYSGDPSEFAWVLPVREGAKLQLSNDAFFTALDASTQPLVFEPSTYGGRYGCGLTGCASEEATSSSEGPGPGQVQILAQSVVGPYETVTLRATDPTALRSWLRSHAFVIPESIGPTVDAYVAEAFDFIALRLRPDCGERSMQPVRIVTRGADPTLPLRMVAAGVGAKVGLTLYVISEGRWQPRNFPHATIDEARVQWDRVQQRSTYEALTQELMAEHQGRTWVSEYADQPQLFTMTDPRYGGRPAPGYLFTAGPGSVTPPFADTYYSQCRARGAVTPAPANMAPTPSSVPFTPCRNAGDAGVGTRDGGGGDAASASDAGDAGDGGELDASSPDLDAGDEPEGGPGDAGEEDAGETRDPSAACAYLDDIDVALRGLHPSDVWITRLRASLPVGALAGGDLVLEPAEEQTPLTNVHYATSYTDDNSSSADSSCVSAPKRHRAFGSWGLAALCVIGGLAYLRRRTRR